MRLGKGHRGGDASIQSNRQGSCPRASQPLALGLVLLCACSLNHLTPQARFSESAFVLNDAARWGQLSHAAQYVAPSYQPAFAQRHREWGKRISIAEVELLSLQIDPEGDAAVSEVALTWYDQSGMTLHTSWITQRWRGKRGDFRLTGEDVRDGSPHVFAEVSSGGSGPVVK